MSLLNKKAVRDYLLDTASKAGRTCFTRVSAEALQDAEANLKNYLRDYVHKHRQCKTIGKR